MLDANNSQDLLSIEKSRNIVKEILDYGVSQGEILKIIEIISLELEDREKMNNILNIVKNSKSEKDLEEPKKELIL